MATICKIQGCNGPVEARDWCQKHYARWRHSGDPLATKIRERGNAVHTDGYKVYAGQLEHVLIARLEVVHHVDENRLNNSHDNLVICSHAYHMLIHARMRAKAACGNASWRRCRYCGKYDDPLKMYTGPHQRHAYHRSCRRAHQENKP
jgi:hypothetical protein